MALYQCIIFIEVNMSADQKKPDQIYPLSPTSMPSMMPVNIPDVSLKGISFDQLLQNRGIRFIHRRASPCPNMRTIFDNSHEPNCQICDGQGIMYYAEKEIFGVFYSNSLEKNFEMQGIWEIGTAFVTVPTEYSDGKQAEFNTFDQLVIPDFTVRMWELKEYKPTSNNRQRLRYKAYNTDYVGYAENGVIVELLVDVDFKITDGEIEWINGGLAYDAENDRGKVFVIQYYANPVYNILQHMRELRISQEYINGQKVAKRLPQQLLCKRDFLSNPPAKEGTE